ncbi:MAG: GAF domain-containing protein [Bacteroidetes bacterium]|nr:GAF domain-containing protein [Bacteroidota bacterium]
MIEQIQLFLKDPAKVARVATVGFFVMVVIVAWFLFTLPHDLVYKGGMIDSGRAASVYAKLFTVIGLAFAFCYALIFFAQKTKKETIVYLDKKIESGANEQGFTSGQSQDSLNLNSIRDKIKSGSKEEKWQNGLNELCDQLKAGQGALYLANKKGESKSLEMKSGYAIVLAEGEENPSFNWGEGLIGQVAASGKSLYLDELPEGYAARIESGLGSALPRFLFILPLQKENETIGVVEVATFTNLSETLRKQAQEAGIILSEII